MRYHCYKCSWTGPDSEVAWKNQWINSEAWGVYKNQKDPYATCPDCGSDDVGEMQDESDDGEDCAATVLLSYFSGGPLY